MNKELMTVFLEDKQLGLYLSSVREIFSVKKIIEVPGSKEFVKGIVNYRGNVIPIVNLKTILGMKNKDYSEDVLEYTIIIENGDVIIGLMVDKIKGIFEIDEDVVEKQKIPEMDDMDKKFISSIVEIDGVKTMILNIENIISFNN